MPTSIDGALLLKIIDLYSKWSVPQKIVFFRQLDAYIVLANSIVLCFAPECPEPPSVAAIIVGSIASVALIGIALLLLIKLLIYMKDLKEFQKFENEKKKSKWAEVRICFTL